MTLAELMRSIRKRMHMTTSEFARRLGVSQSVVSRYEKGDRAPAWRVLARLFLMAEGAREKGIVMDAISGAKGRPVSEAVAQNEATESVREDDFLARISERPELPNLARFAYFSSMILRDGREVDESLNILLAIWKKYGGTAASERYFSDAARFLEIALVDALGESAQTLLEEADSACSPDPDPMMMDIRIDEADREAKPEAVRRTKRKAG